MTRDEARRRVALGIGRWDIWDDPDNPDYVVFLPGGSWLRVSWPKAGESWGLCGTPDDGGSDAQ
jgi:hypothetical protein